jgi:hypothetical protein
MIPSSSGAALLQSHRGRFLPGGGKGLLLSVLPLLCVLVSCLAVSSAFAAQPSPGLTIESLAQPSSFSTADTAGCLKTFTQVLTECDSYEVTARNAGARSSEGAITLSDTLPPTGLVIRSIDFYTGGGATLENHAEDCVELPTPEVRCTFAGVLAPDQTLRLVVSVTVNNGASGSLTNSATISGGGVSAATETNNEVGSPPPFGFSRFDFAAYGLGGALDTQAGDHPYELTTTIGLNSALRASEGHRETTSVEDPRDIVTDLPVGFVGSILAAPQCTFGQLAKVPVGCPADTVVGHILTEPGSSASIDSAIYNMAPEKGVPAEFAYVDALDGTHVFYVHLVPTPKGYVLQVVNPEIPQIALKHIVVTFYGDPAEKDDTGNAAIPFFTNPTDCAGEEPTATLYMDSWTHPAKFNPDGTPVNLSEPQWAKMESTSPPVTGCSGLRFPAEIKAQPTTHESDKPSGMDFQIKLPQSETVGVPATPTLKKVVAKLPEGFTVDPAAGNGLQACSANPAAQPGSPGNQIGWLGPDGPNGERLPNGGHLNFSEAPPACPEASKIGTLELETPLVPHALKGELFLASQNANPYGATLAAYVVVDDPITGVLIKISGEFLPNANTGQMTAVFDENPNLPFSNLELHFFGGPRAELATPESCGAYTTNTELTPWSFPESGLPASPFDDFLINEACPGGFNPSFAALSTNVQAGAYTPFEASFERSDADQELAGLTVTLPPGLLAKVTGVAECSEAQIQEAEESKSGCPESTQVGSVETSVGPGPDPLQVAGKAYWTGPYKGGPFGLAVVVPAVAGPYNFGTVVVRQSIRLNPQTAQVTDVSDPFPSIIDGIPLRLRRVDLTLNRAGFTFNPTSCAKQEFTGAIAGNQLGSPTTLNGTIGYATEPGASKSFTAPFQVTNCEALKFEPKFVVSTSGKTSKSQGASLTATVSEPPGSLGTQANISLVKVELPKQLPSRLTTLQKACTAKVFDANPAGCPKESIVGMAIAHTPLLNNPLTGPAYFVSHGNEAFPQLIVVLQGENGLVVELVGDTFISKAGITSSTFAHVPDVPVSSFELTLPQGKFSALTANANLCTVKGGLKMPTEFTAQNGAVLKQNTAIAVSGCPKAKTAAQLRAAKLAAALKACHKKHGSKRSGCEKLAHKRYNPLKKKPSRKK